MSMTSLSEVPQGVRRNLAHGLLRVSRPKQWAKNVYLFAALVFAGQLFNLAALGQTLFAFALFCMASSSVYVLNDIVDRDRDKLHPKKRFRPIPSGQLPVSAAWLYLAVLPMVWVPLGFWLSGTFGAILVGYFCMNLLYSFVLEHVFLLDVIVIAIGFVLRAIGGAVLIHVAVSPWLFVCTILVSLFLVLGKRRNELLTLRSNSGSHRKTLSMYTVALVDQFITITAGATLVAYSLYSFYSSPTYSMMYTIPFVVYGLFRYLYLVHQSDLTGSPDEALFSDVPSLINITLWGLTVVILLYGGDVLTF